MSGYSMKKQIVFIHGAEAYSDYEDFLTHLRTVEVNPFAERQKRWYRNLSESFGQEFEIIAPSMPNSDNAKYTEWKIWFERHFEFLKNDVILIGHSQGGIFLTKYLVENNPPFSAKALFLIGSVVDVSERFFGALEDGADFTFDVSALPTLCSKVPKIHVLHSKDDFCVPFEQGKKLAAALPEAEFVVYEDKNHFLIEEFPELVEKIKSLG
jgi:uncharacterized protein